MGKGMLRGWAALAAVAAVLVFVAPGERSYGPGSALAANTRQALLSFPPSDSVRDLFFSRPGDTAGAPEVPVVANAKQALLAVPSGEAVVFEALMSYDRLAALDQEPAVAPGHVVVKFLPALSARTAQSIAGSVGAIGMKRPSYADFHYVQVPEGTDPTALAAVLASRPGVIYAEPDEIVRPHYVPDDPLYRYQWHLHNIGMEQAWSVNRGGDGSIVVAVLDTGVAYLDKGMFAQAPDLAGTRFTAPYDFIWGDEEPVDLDGHGTHVAGTIAQTTNNGIGTAGIAFNVTIMPVKVLSGQWDTTLGAPFPYGTSVVARGIRYAADNGARVINMSLGGFSPSTAVEDALRYAVSRGAVVVASAGNDGERENRRSYPAAYARDIPGVIAVGAVDFANNRARYSTRGDYVGVAAPGGDLRADLNSDGYGDGILQQTLDPDFQGSGVFNRFAYMFYNGTSMAAAHVSGVAALLMHQGIRSPEAVEAALKHFARDLGPQGWDEETGHGLIRPRETLRGMGLAR
jgi:serine protease